MNTTDDIFTDTNTTLPRAEQEATRFIDVHIYTLSQEQEDEETRMIEATLEKISEENQPPPDRQQEQTEPIRNQSKRRTSPIAYAVTGIVLLTLLGKGYLYLLPLLTPTATVTITPVSKQVSTTGSISLVSGSADPTKDQIAGRLLPSVTRSHAQTIPTTGKTTIPAQSAHGMLIFYNAAPYLQTIEVGTLLTGKDGVQVITDQTVSIPAVQYPTLGQASVSAHTVIAGAQGNIQAGDIYGNCCLLNISAVNGVFSGGQEAESYQSVSQTDITTTAATIKKNLTRTLTNTMQAQVHSDETVLTPIPCTPTATEDHQPGDNATHVTVTVNETCTGMTYLTQDFQSLVSRIETQAAYKQLGGGYSSAGDIQSTIVQTTSAVQGTVTLHVHLSGLWVYHFTDTELAQMIQQIAGKPRTQALTLLSQRKGVNTVTADNTIQTLPTNQANIHLVVWYTQ